MIFLQLKKETNLDGFSHGEVYPAIEQSSGSAVDHHSANVVNDNGMGVHLNKHRLKRFSYQSMAFVIWLRDGKTNVAGDVSLVDDGDETSFRIEGNGWKSRDGFRIADRKLMYPNVWVCDLKDGYWKQIVSVNDSQWVSVLYGEPRSLTEFRFIVSDGQIVSEPFATCVDASGSDHLKEGDMYRVIWCDSDSWLIEIGEEKLSYSKSRFKF